MALTWRVCRKYLNEVFDIKNEEEFKTKVLESQETCDC